MRGFTSYAILDAARDYKRIGFARIVSSEYDHLFEGDTGDRIEHVAPHLFVCDPKGMIDHLTVAGLPPGDVGILVDTPWEYEELRRHLRRFLTVIRERDQKQVFFRYYDPRVLRVFLPVCTPDELTQFFGPIHAFHCQTEVPGSVLTYTLQNGRLHTSQTSLADFICQRHEVSINELKQLISASHSEHSQ